MVATEWMTYAGVEVLNAARVAAYAGQRGIEVACTGCADLAASLGDAPYTTPDADDAPWWDPAVPDSTDFCGVLGLEITGASDGTTERNVAEFLGDGAALGAGRQASREIEVKALAVAATQAGLSYGLGWLHTALLGSACASGCTGDTLCVYAACPQQPADNTDPCATEQPTRGGWDPIAAGDELLRTLFDVALTEGPTVDSQQHVGNAWIAEVSFTVTAGKPWWWRMPRPALDTGTPPDYTDVIPGYEIIGPVCPEPTDCMDENPYCTGANRPWPDEPFPGSQPSDTTLLDPCYPTEPFTARRAMWRIPMDSVPEWNSTVPVFQLHSGSLPLHRVTLRWYSNPRNRLPTADLDPCSACAEMTIPWIPSRTTLTIDSRTRTTTANCRGQGAINSNVTVYGPRGGAYTWPEFDCSTPLIAELIVLDSSLNSDTTWSVQLAAKMGAV